MPYAAEAETIATVLTPPAAGAIGVVRVEGPDAAARLAACLDGVKPGAIRPGRHVLARLTDGRGTIDEVVVVPRSESAFEICTHGGVGMMEAVQSLLGRAGFRPGEPHETLARQVAAGELNLLEAEEMMVLGTCQTERQARAVSGAGRALAEELEQLSTKDPAFSTRLDALVRRARYIRRLLAEHAVVLAGPVNTGKSSLANRLSREARAIVSGQAGTTRDAAGRRCAIRGLSMVIVDTAGWRHAADELEAAGIDRAVKAAQASGLVVLVLDGTKADQSEADAFLGRAGIAPDITAANKSDLGAAEGVPGMRISALTGEGLDALEDAIESALLPARPEGALPFTRRQAELLAAARDHPETARTAMAELMGDGLNGTERMERLADAG